MGRDQHEQAEHDADWSDPIAAPHDPVLRRRKLRAERNGQSASYVETHVAREDRLERCDDDEARADQVVGEQAERRGEADEACRRQANSARAMGRFGP
jgi:hypothetical protein